MPARSHPALLGTVGHDLHRPECVLAHASGLLFAPDWSGAGGIAAITPDGDVHRLLAGRPLGGTRPDGHDGHAGTPFAETPGGEASRAETPGAGVPIGGAPRRESASGGAPRDGGTARTSPADARAERVPRPLRPNGIALEPGGSFLLAHLGERDGGIYRLHADGRVEAVVTTVDGQPMPPANFVVTDAVGRLWITVSTRVRPRAADYRADASSGFIALAEPGASDARIVADGLGYANECVVDIGGGALHVNETFGRRLTRFTLAADGSLGERRTLARFGEGTYPDGLALDVEGALLVTSIVSNRVLRVRADGGIETLLEDADAAHVAWVEAAYRADELGRAHLDTARGSCLHNVSNLACGGSDMRTAWLGNLLGTTIPFLRLDVPGVPMPHHDVPLGPLAALLDAAGTPARGAAER